MGRVLTISNELRGHPATEGLSAETREVAALTQFVTLSAREARRHGVEPLPSYGVSARGRPRSRLAGGIRRM
jgi:hypothetical protein